MARTVRSTLLQGLLTLQCVALAESWNAASVWGLQTNATFRPKMANVLFEASLTAIDDAYRTNGAQGLFHIEWTEPRPEMSTLGYCPSPIPRFHNRCAPSRSWPI